MTSLRLVSPGMATNGVTLFLLKKATTFFSHCPLRSDSFFSYRLITTPTLCAFQLRFSTVLCKFSCKKLISFGCHPLDGVTWGCPPPPLLPPAVMPLRQQRFRWNGMINVIAAIGIRRTWLSSVGDHVFLEQSATWCHLSSIARHFSESRKNLRFSFLC